MTITSRIIDAEHPIPGFHNELVSMKAISQVHLDCSAPTLATLGMLRFGFTSKSCVCNNLAKLLACLKPVKFILPFVFLSGSYRVV